MNGQWIGTYTGAATGNIIVNLDDRGDHYGGVAFLISMTHGSEFPAAFAELRINKEEKVFTCKNVFLRQIYPHNKQPITPEELKSLYPEITFPREAEISGQWDNERLFLSWATDIGTNGSAELAKSNADTPSEYKSLATKDWNGYKNHISGLQNRRYLFRGQNEPWRLRTKFHRHGRADVGRFVREDVQALYKHLSAGTKHIFDLRDADQNGAFFNLVQHHGYPTPLLDWTYSPYVGLISPIAGLLMPRLRKTRIKKFVFLFSTKNNGNRILLNHHLWISLFYISQFKRALALSKCDRTSKSLSHLRFLVQRYGVRLCLHRP